MELTDIAEAARATRSRFAQFEKRSYGRSWTTEEVMLGFVGDVGDLAKLVQTAAGVRTTDADVITALAHELADCLWCVLTLADAFSIDLEHAFTNTMQELDAWLSAREG
jgi:NTP pyrophosphatase (non-canonical NTP hydrolase)